MPAQNTPPRTYAAAHFALELDGKETVGLFRSIEGGSIKTDVMTYQQGANYDRWRQLGRPKFEDLKFQVGMSMSKPFYTWIKDFFTGVPTRKSGAIIATDFYYKERARREFKEALIKELVFPKLDGSDKGAAYMSVGVAVEDMTFKPGDGRELKTNDQFRNAKVWTSCNFRFKLDGFGDQCTRISKVDSFTIKQNILEYPVGGLRRAIKAPSQVDFPQISFYLPESDIAPFEEHLFKRGVNGEVPGRMTGMIQTFDNERRNLFTLSFRGADIVGITPDKHDSSTEEIKQAKVDLYVEAMEFEYLAMEVV